MMEPIDASLPRVHQDKRQAADEPLTSAVNDPYLLKTVDSRITLYI
jgi:hypothetical protein